MGVASLGHNVKFLKKELAKIFERNPAGGKVNIPDLLANSFASSPADVEMWERYFWGCIRVPVKG